MELFKLFGTIALKGVEDAQKQVSSVSKVAETAGKKLIDAGKSIEKAGKFFAPFSAAAGGALAASGKMASSFEDAMAKVSTIADTTQVPLTDLSKSIMDLSNNTGIAATEIADNVYNAISAGQSTGDAVNFVSKSTMLAKAGFAEAGSALDVLTTIMNAYGLEASEVDKVSDMLIQTQNLGKTTVGELASAMGKVIPTANAMGVGLDNLTASYTILTAKGIATAEATTYTNSMLNELGDSGTTVGKILKEKTGMSFQNLMADGKSLGDVLGILQDYSNDSGKAFNELWGSSEAGKAAMSLLSDGVEEFNDRVDQMNKSTGSTQEAFDKLNTTSTKVKKSLNTLKNTGIQLGTALLDMLAPVIESVGDKVSKLSDWISGLDDNQKKMIVTVGLVVAAIAPVLIGVGKVITTIGTLISIGGTMLTFLAGLNPVLLLIGIAIAAVVAVGVLLYKNWDQIKASAQSLAAAIAEKWEEIKTSISEKVASAVATVTSKFQDIKTTITSNLNTAKSTVINTFDAIKTAISEKINAAKNAVKTAIDTMKSFFNFEWSLPAIKLPHFNISGGFSLNPPSAPDFSVQWYKSGGILTKPTIFGMQNGQLLGGGEAGKEAVAPIDVLQGYVSSAVAAQNERLAEILDKILFAVLDLDENMGGNLREALKGTSLTVNGREFARLVKAVE